MIRVADGDHSYDHFRGVVSLVRLFSGTIKKGDKIRFLQSDRKYEVLEVGIQNPEEVIVDALQEGQVGYVVCNMKNSEDGELLACDYIWVLGGRH